MRGYEPRNEGRQMLEKTGKWILLRASRKNVSPAGTLTSLPDPCQISDPVNCKVINLCCSWLGEIGEGKGGQISGNKRRLGLG